MQSTRARTNIMVPVGMVDWQIFFRRLHRRTVANVRFPFL